jgi:hypothetical protein
VTGVTAIAGFGRLWTWLASAVTLLLLAGLFHHPRTRTPKL